jgi:type VI secretion system secreted protein VgrG
MDILSPLRLGANELEFVLHIDGMESEALYVLDFKVSEELNKPFSLQVTALCADDQLPLGRFIGHDACLTAITPSSTRHFHGLVSEMEICGRSRRFARYQVQIVPRLWLLSRRRDSRIFQSLSTPEILTQVLEAAGIAGEALELRLSRDYEPRDYCVQYRETDLAFVSRLMEEEGIGYTFSHSATGHRLILQDDTMTHDDLTPASILFLPSALSGGAGQHIEELTFSRSIQPGKATLRDFCFKGPSEDLEVSVSYDGAGAEVDTEAGDNNTDLEVYDYPGEYVDRGLGEALARLRLEQLQVQRFHVQGRSTARRLCPGYRMEIAGHEREGLNRPWLLTQVRHVGTQPHPDKPDERGQPATYRNTFGAIPAELTWRPPQSTPRPVIAGLQTAVVTGPAGEELHTDEFGRVKVQFHWDRHGQKDADSSCWVRVSHPSAGAGFGQLILPRVGQEVIVQFLEGDPDRPVVTGRLYNGEQTPPHPLPDGKVRSTLKSSSYPGGGGYNEFTFDDTAGAEQIVLHGQKDGATTIGNDQSTSIGNNLSTSVGTDESHSVGGNRSVSVGGDESCSVSGNRTAAVTGKEAVTVDGGRSITVTSGESRTIDGGETESITGDHSVTVDGNQTESITGTSALSVAGGMATVSVTGTWALDASVTANMHAGTTINIDSGSDLNANSTNVVVGGSSSVMIHSSSSVVIMVGGSVIAMDSSSITLSAATINLSGAVTNINGSASLNLTGAAVSSSATGINTVAGATVKLN